MPFRRVDDRYLLKFSFVACGYFALSYVGLMLASINASTSPVWPASGFALAALILFGPRYWPAVFLGAAAGNFLSGMPPLAVVIVSLGCALEAYVGYRIYARWKKYEAEDLGNDYANLLAIASVSSVVSAAIGVSTLVLTKTIPSSDFGASLLTWFLGDAVGVIAVTPVMVYFASLSKNRAAFRPLRVLFTLILASSVTTCIFIVEPLRPFIFVLFPILLLSLGISGKPGAYLAGLACACLAIYFTTKGLSPFSWGTQNQNFLALQIFLGILALTAHFIVGLPDVARPRDYLQPLLFGWVLAGLIFYSYFSIHANRDGIRLTSLTAQYSQQVETRFSSYVNILKDGVGLYAASEDVKREEWRTYVEALKLHERFPGLRGMGVIRIVKKSETDDFVARERRSYPGYQRKTFTQDFEDEDERYLIQYVEPIESNAPALGVDIGSEISRRKIAQDSLRTGLPTVTQPIQIIQDKEKRLGFLLMVPFFKSEKVRGWIYAPIVLQDFLEDAIIAQRPELDFQVNFLNGSFRTPVFESDPNDIELRFPHTSSTSVIKMAQGNFEFVWRKNRHFISSHDFTLSWVGALGALLVMTFTSMLVSSRTFRDRAEALVIKQTKLISESQRLMRTLMEAAPVGFVQLSPDGKFIYSNSKWTEISGFTENEIVKLNRRQIIFGPDLEKVEKVWFGFLKNSNPFDLRFRIMRSDGQLKWVQVIATRIRDEANRTEGFVAVVVDVTEAMAQQLSLETERAKAIESAKLASLGEMAGGIAHEINNPLMIIQAQAEQLIRITKDERVVAGMGRIERTVGRIAKIIKGMRALSRNSDNDEFAPARVSAILEDVIDLCQERFRQSAVALNVEIIDDFVIDCRATQISQVLLNLLNNSYDAVRGDRRSWTQITVFRAENKGIITVTDSGSGIPKDVADRIMDPFFTTKSIEKGTGLGLSISRNIMRDHGAEFYLDQKSPNTKFVLEFNIKPVNSEGAHV